MFLIIWFISAMLCTIAVPRLVEINASPLWMIVFFIPGINTLFGLWVLYRKLSNFKKVKKYFKINIKSIIETLKNI
jgi:hypothetical protein